MHYWDPQLESFAILFQYVVKWLCTSILDGGEKKVKLHAIKHFNHNLKDLYI